MANTNNPEETGSNTAGTAVEQSATAAAGDQSRMCCAVGDLSCVVPVVVTSPGVACEPEAEGPAQMPEKVRGDQQS